MFLLNALPPIGFSEEGSKGDMKRMPLRPTDNQRWLKYGIPEQESFIPTDCSHSSPKQRSRVEVQTRKSIHYTQFLNLCCFLVVDKVMKNDSSTTDSLEILKRKKGDVLSTAIKNSIMFFLYCFFFPLSILLYFLSTNKFCFGHFLEWIAEKFDTQ